MSCEIEMGSSDSSDYPETWPIKAFFDGATNKWLYEKTAGRFIDPETVKKEPNKCHFIFLRTKCEDSPANEFSPCTSLKKSNTSYVEKGSPLYMNGQETTFKFHKSTYILSRLRIHIPFSADINDKLRLLGIAKNEQICNYYLLYDAE